MGGRSEVSRTRSITLYEVRRRSCAVAKDSGSSVQGGLAVLGADRDLQEQQRRQEGCGFHSASNLGGQEDRLAVPRQHRLVFARGASAIHGSEEHAHIWAHGGIVCRFWKRLSSE